MSVSIDDHPPEKEGVDDSALGVLAGWLDDYSAGRCERADMEEAFMSVCRADSEASWDALSLLDRYQRLGRVDADLARDLKSKIAQLAVGAPKQAQPLRASRSPAAASETKWGKSPDADRPKHDTTEQKDRKAFEQEAHTHDIRDSDAPPTRLPELDTELTRIRRPIVEDVPEDLDEDSDDDDEAAEPTVMPMRSVVSQPSPFAENARELRRTPAPRPPAARSAAEPVRSPRVAAPSPAGRRVLRDRYELLAVIGHGKTSTIYKALDRHRANLAESARHVAVKVFNATYDGRAEALAELEREFHQAQSLSHPNIANVFDLDRDGSTYFIVMELLEGESLAGVLRRLEARPMARKHALALIGSIGAALAHAHRRDIVHGDLKPRNVMITPMGELRVLEFGFARAGPLAAGELDAARDAVSIGTPAYASIERVQGFEPDPSDDVYSLACIAYELLAGRHPYGGRSALLARAHGRRAQRIPGLSHKQWHALQRALSWQRADRKIDVVDLLGALGTSDVPQEAVPPELLTLPDDGGKWKARALVAAVLVAATGLGVFLVVGIPPPVQNIDVTTAVPSPPPQESETSGSSPAEADAEPRTAQSAPQTAAEGQQAEPATTRVEEQPIAAARPGASSPTSDTSPSTQGASRAESPSQPPAAAAGEPRSEQRASAGVIQFEKDTFVVTESDGAVRLQVRRSGSTRGVLSFRWSLRSNSAEAGSDFAAIGPGLEQIPSGVSSVTILVPLVSDAITENTELFLAEIEAVDEGVTVGELGHAAVIIVDDD